MGNIRTTISAGTDRLFHPFPGYDTCSLIQRPGNMCKNTQIKVGPFQLIKLTAVLSVGLLTLAMTLYIYYYMA